MDDNNIINLNKKKKAQEINKQRALSLSPHQLVERMNRLEAELVYRTEELARVVIKLEDRINQLNNRLDKLK